MPGIGEKTASRLIQQFYADPYDEYRRLRDESPVWWDENARLWAVSRHADVLAISRDPHTFCNGRGVLVSQVRIER